MKRVRCPKCDQYITFDEKQYSDGQSLVFQCPQCGKSFGIRIGVSKLKATQKEENAMLNQDNGQQAADEACGSIVVIENVFHYKQVIPLQMGDNVIGRYQKGNPINTPFETVDPSVDLNHCTINVSRDKHGRLRYTLSDATSTDAYATHSATTTATRARLLTTWRSSSANVASLATARSSPSVPQASSCAAPKKKNKQFYLVNARSEDHRTNTHHR